MTLKLHNTLTRSTDEFTPLEAGKVRMYVCGPTVYDRPHIGNARSVVVYDALYRLLNHLYGQDNVTFVRNITDVDDKINARAKERSITIQELTKEVTGQFHADMDALNVLRPTVEPRATEHIGQMIRIIEKLLENHHAYVRAGHVMFDIASVDHYEAEMGNNPDTYVYGMLSHRVTDDLHSGARVAVENYKKNDGDFVLWKPADEEDDASSVFDSPWGQGRPGWHIECSAMSGEYLGKTFDIHGGGADLMFPHHENEIAQSRCADSEAEFAKIWVHNGFLTVGGEKMSKSLGNFTTVYDLLQKGIRPEVIRYALLSTHYRKPLDWNEKLVEDARKTLDRLYRKLLDAPENPQPAPQEFIDALSDDLNLPLAFSLLHHMPVESLQACGDLLGVLQSDPKEWFQGAEMPPAEDGGPSLTGNELMTREAIEALIQARLEAKQNKDFAAADQIRDDLKAAGIILEDKPGNKTEWRRE